MIAHIHCTCKRANKTSNSIILLVTIFIYFLETEAAQNLDMADSCACAGFLLILFSTTFSYLRPTQ